MKRITFTKEDRQYFSDSGYSDDDIKQIVRLRYRVTTYSNDMPFEKACETFGRKYILGAIGRAAFHSSGNINGTEWNVESNLFKQNNN